MKVLPSISKGYLILALLLPASATTGCSSPNFGDASQALSLEKKAGQKAEDSATGKAAADEQDRTSSITDNKKDHGPIKVCDAGGAAPENFEGGKIDLRVCKTNNPLVDSSRNIEGVSDRLEGPVSDTVVAQPKNVEDEGRPYKVSLPLYQNSLALDSGHGNGGRRSFGHEAPLAAVVLKKQKDGNYKMCAMSYLMQEVKRNGSKLEVTLKGPAVVQAALLKNISLLSIFPICSKSISQEKAEKLFGSLLQGLNGAMPNDDSDTDDDEN